jgi:predicted component of type VI protein secretion system
MAELVGKNENYAGRSIHLPETGGVIGRDPRNHVVITHESVSSLHAMLRVENGALFVRDQQSTNGTRLNGHDIQDGQLQDGDELEIGNVLFTVSAPEFSKRGATQPEPAPVVQPSTPVASRSISDQPAPAPAPVLEHTDEGGFLLRPSPLNTVMGAGVAVILLILLVRYLSSLSP